MRIARAREQKVKVNDRSAYDDIVALRMMISINSIFHPLPPPTKFSTDLEIIFSSFCDFIAGLMGESFLNKRWRNCGFITGHASVLFAVVR